MLSELKILKLSEKVKEYIKKVEEETERPVLLKSVQDVWLYGTGGVFKLDPEYILVDIIEDKYLDFKGEVEQEEIEYMIAHEVTHGLLAYKEKYCQFRFRGRMYNELVVKSASLLFTMVEDIVVSKIIYENNFQQYPQIYIPQIEYEIECARVGEDAYKPYTPLKFKYRYMVFRYILVWGLLKYIKLDEIGRKKSYEYLEMFKKSYPKQYAEAKKIKEIILENDIFTPEGFCNAIKKCLDLNFWNLTNLVEIYQI